MRNPLVSLVAMSFAAFVYVSYEIFAVGLISTMANDLGVSEGSIGLLTTVYAGVVAVVTLPLMHLTRNINRTPLFMTTLVFLLAGVVLQAIAVNYPMLAVARITAAVTHGLFWSLINPMAARVAGPGRTGKAVATVSMGSTMALVIGSPTVTYLGGLLGWRTTTWILGAFVIVAIAVLVASLPSMPVMAKVQASGDKKQGSLMTSLVIFVALGITAAFATYTYIGLIVEEIAGEEWIAPSLLLYGIVGVFGVLWAGQRVDRRMIRLNVMPPLMMLVGALIGVCAIYLHGPVAIVFALAFLVLFGMGDASIPTTATTVFLHAGKDNQDRASAIYVVTFQVGIAAGSALGAVIVDAGALVGTMIISAVLATASVAVMALWSRPLLR